jgi:hypothetical protein
MSRFGPILYEIRRFLFPRLTYLEAENERLREELRLWQDALLQKEGLPHVHLRDKDPLPKLKRRVLPSQWRSEAEKAAIPLMEKKPDA